MFGDRILNECIECPEGCSNCESTEFCSSCDLGYQLNYLDLCEPCDDLCLDCEENKCKECKFGYFGNSKHKCVQKCGLGKFGNAERSVPVCEDCPTQCTKCDTYDVCTACIPGFELTDAGKCQGCGDNCATCENEICSVCNEGLLLD